MNLRLRLIVAFFLLSVVPLGAVTFYTYMSSAKAVRDGALAEAEQLTGELTQRMDLVMARLSEKVGDYALSDDSAVTPTGAVRAASTSTVVPEPPQTPVAPAPPPAPAAPASSARSASPDRQALGDMAMLLNNIQVVGARRGGGGRGRGGPPGGERDGGPGSRGDGNARGPRGDGGGRGGGGGRGDSVGPPSGSVPSPAASSGGGTAPPAPGSNTASARDAGPGRGPAPTFSGRGDTDGQRRGGGGPNQPSRGGRGDAPGDSAVDADSIRIDLMPIRRELEAQLAGTDDWASLSPEEWQRIRAQANERVLGIEQGIRLGQVELQKRVAVAQQAAEAKAREAARTAKTAPAPARVSPASQSPAAVAPAAAGRTQRTAAMSGNRLDVRMERDGQVVQANAELNLTNVLDTVWTPRRRARGEVPFAVARDGQVYAPNADDRSRIEALGVAHADAPPGTTVLADWIVVTSADPASGLKFGIARPVGESLNELRRAGARNVGLGLGLIGLALIGIFPLSSRLTRNLSTLSDGVRRIAKGDYRARVKVASHDEIGRLAQAFNQMAEDVEQHQRAAVGQERIKRELELGRQIQHDMLPHGPLQLGLTQISGVSVPAREVGGDFFNYFALGNGEIALLVGDVSGKGVGAALLMANLQASLRTRLALGQDLAAIARELDLDIEGNTPGTVYATLFVGILNPDTRELRYVNAGHNPQYILRGDRLERMYSSGLPVGLLAGHGYTETRVPLAAGDRLFFYTDGCVEAENEAGEMFTTERLEELLLSVGAETDVLARVESVVSEFRGTREPFDDATMMVVKVG